MKHRLIYALSLLILVTVFFFVGRLSATYEIHVTERGKTCAKAEVKESPIKERVEVPPPPTPMPGAKVDIDFATSDSPYQGKENAPIIFAEFSDFQCPFCKNSQDVVNRIMSEYDGKIKRVFKNNPLPFHQDAMLAHQAGMAAHKQGKFWEMMQKIFDNQQNIKEDDLQRYAKEIGLNMKKFDSDWKSEKIKSKISQDMSEGGRVDVRGTPTFFINGRKLVGAVPFENFKAIIDEELKINTP